MIQLTSAAQLAKAVARAKASDLLVRPTSIFRQYLVTNRANRKTYVVDDNDSPENGPFGCRQSLNAQYLSVPD